MRTLYSLETSSTSVNKELKKHLKKIQLFNEHRLMNIDKHR